MEPFVGLVPRAGLRLRYVSRKLREKVRLAWQRQLAATDRWWLCASHAVCMCGGGY